MSVGRLTDAVRRLLAPAPRRVRRHVNPLPRLPFPTVAATLTRIHKAQRIAETAPVSRDDAEEWRRVADALDRLVRYLADSEAGEGTRTLAAALADRARTLADRGAGG